MFFCDNLYQVRFISIFMKFEELHDIFVYLAMFLA